MEQTNRIEHLTHDGEDSQALEPLAALDVSAHQPDAAEPATDELDQLPGEDIELRNWRATVEAYAAMQAEPFTSDDVLVHGFCMAPEFIEKGDQMRVARILRELGYTKEQRRVNTVRRELWSKPSEAAVSDEQHVEQSAAEHAPAAPQEGGSIVGDAVDDDARPAPSTPAEPARPRESAGSASTRYQQMSARQTEIMRKLADAQRVLHFAQDARKQAALAAADGGGFVAEAAYEKAVDKHKEAGAHVEQLTEALSQISTDLQRASVYAEAERRVQQCNAVRDMARAVEGYGPKIEGLLAELGKAVSGYLHDINVVHRKSWPVLTGAREVAAPLTEPVACALLGHFLRSSGLDPAFFIELTSHGMNGLLRYETPSQIVDMQLGNITERLADNYLEMIEVREGEPETEDCAETWAEAAPGHELVPAGIFPAQSTTDEA